MGNNPLWRELQSQMVKESTIVRLKRLDSALKGYNEQLVLVIYNAFVKDSEESPENYLKTWRLSVLTSPHIYFSKKRGPSLPTSQYVQKVCTHENEWSLHEGNLLSWCPQHHGPTLIQFSMSERALTQLPVMYIGDAKIRRMFSRKSLREAMNLLRI